MHLQVQIESLKNDIYASKPLNLWALSYKCWLSYQKDKIYGSAFKFSTLSSFKCNVKGWKMFQVIVIRFLIWLEHYIFHLIVVLSKNINLDILTYVRL